jgi:Suppressor of fused protein (SUFU)
MDDTIEIVLENYRDWLGIKPMIYQVLENFGVHSAHFSILTYQKETYQLLCTAGASKTDIPKSKGKFGKRKSCAYEYLIHCGSENLMDFHEILLKVSNYPYLVNEFVYSGSVIPFGENILNSQMNYLYLTDPYEDDAEIYSKFPDGQMILPNKVIQTLWIIPIYSSEADEIKKYGAEHFDSLLGKSIKDFGNLHRKSLI